MTGAAWFVVRRGAHLIAVLVLVSFAAFTLLRLLPGDPALTILGGEATPAELRAVQRDLGLDEPLPLAYVAWLGGILRGDFGTSYVTNEPVSQMIVDGLPVTIELATLAIVLSVGIAVPAATIVAYRRRGLTDRIADVTTAAFISAPPFLTGLILVYLFVVTLDLFPATGWVPLSESLSGNVHHLVLPVVALSVTEIAVFFRVLRSDLRTTLEEEFITAARARGLKDGTIMFRQALKPSSLSLVTLAGLSLGRMLGGAVVVEVLFALPGLGQLVVNALYRRDYVVVQGAIVVIAVIYVVINTIVDVAYRRLDPRVRGTVR